MPGWLKSVLGLLVAALLFGVAFFVVRSKWHAAEAERVNIIQTRNAEARQQQKAASRARPLGPPADFNIPLLAVTGQRGSLEAFRGRTIFLNRWATWCGPCREEMPSIQKLYNAMKDSGIAFVLVSDEEPAVVRDFISKTGYTFPVFIIEGEFPPIFQTNSIPATWLISKKGEVAGHFVGSKDWNAPEIHTVLTQLDKFPVDK